MADLKNADLRLLADVRAQRVNRVGTRDYRRHNANLSTVKAAVTMTPVLDYAYLGDDAWWHLNEAGDAALDEWIAAKAERAPAVSGG